MSHCKSPVKLDESNIRRFSYLFCAAQRCGKSLVVGDTIISKLGNSKIKHYHEACFDAMHF